MSASVLFAYHLASYVGGMSQRQQRAQLAASPLAPRCYACDATATGTCEHLKSPPALDLPYTPACTRHRDTVRAPWFLCSYCDSPVRAGSLWQDGGQYAHAKCVREQNAS